MMLLWRLAGPHLCTSHATERETPIHLQLSLTTRRSCWQLERCFTQKDIGYSKDIQAQNYIGLARETKYVITGESRVSSVNISKQ